MLEIRSLTKIYPRQVTALQGVDLEIPPSCFREMPPTLEDAYLVVMGCGGFPGATASGPAGVVGP